MTSASPLNRTSLFQRHADLGARLVPFAGWEMPLQYRGILEEARAVRSGAGIFDVSHMGRLFISGSQAQPLLDRLVTADVPRLAHGRCRYCMMCNEEGGTIDDVVLAHLDQDRFLLVCNASNREEVWGRVNALAQDAFPDAALEDRTMATTLIALQGPAAEGILSSLLGEKTPKDALSRSFSITEAPTEWGEAILSRTGYTGEDGFEIVVSADQGPQVWDRLRELGAVPCGLGARDVLRLEAGLRLHGSDMDATITPLEAGLQRYVRMESDFVGRDALQRQQASGLSRQLVGLRLQQRAVARHGYRLLHQGEAVGVVTSGTFSPTLKASIAMGYVPPDLAQVGQPLEVDIRGESMAAEVAYLPFYIRERSP